MSGFLTRFHPSVVFLYFCLTGAVVLFCVDPVVIALALGGALVSGFAFSAVPDRRFVRFLLVTVLFCTLGNPLFVRNGASVLFLINDRPVTLESIVYGAVSGTMIAALLTLSRLFTRYMTADRIHALFGAFSPRIALFFSMTLRFIPRLQEKARTIHLAQKSIGKVREGGMVESIRSAARVFSVLVDWSLENGIVTADSMAARGYGVRRRTSYTLYRFRACDMCLLVCIAALSAVPIYGMLRGWIGFRWYPTIVAPAWSAGRVLSYLAYALLCFLPGILRLWEVIHWRRLQSAI